MRRSVRILVAAVLAALICAPLTVSGTAQAQAGAPFCAPGQPAAFVLGIAALHARLGAPMGDPLECEHVDRVSGDTIQRTTTGLAYHRPSINLAMFTDGETHWALARNQLILWRNASVTPPEATAEEADYLDETAPLRSRFAVLQGQIDAVRGQAAAGQLDTVDIDALTTLVDDLRVTRNAYAAAREAGRLYEHHGLMVTSVNTAMGAAEMLSQARQIEAAEVRNDFLTRAEAHRQESARLQGAAFDAYSQVLPIIVN